MRYAILAGTILLLSACSVFENDAERSVARGFAVPAAFTSADVRLVLHRPRVGTNQEIVCAEPSADVAKAISTAFQGTGSGNGGTGSISVNLGLGGASAEAVAELAGRSTALLGLRDGLYRACEAYANGAIGDDAYALILSRYGQLMTTLFLGQDISGYIGGGGATVKSDVVNVNLPGSGGSTTQQQTNSDGKGKTGQQGSPGAQQQSPSPSSELNLLRSQVVLLAEPPSDAPAADQLCDQPTPSPQPQPGPGAQGGGKQSVSDVAANALASMNKAYFDLDQNEFHLLMVACINEFDSSRPLHGEGNWFLRQICAQATNPAVFKALLDAQFSRMQGTSGVSVQQTVTQRTVGKKTTVRRSPHPGKQPQS